MEEKEKNEQAEVQTESKGIKSFFKKVKDTLGKLDKKLDEVMDSDPYAKKEEKSEQDSAEKKD